MKPIGPRSKPDRFKKLDGRTQLAKLQKSLRADLIAHVGGTPSATQKLLIEQAVGLQLRLSLLDQTTLYGMDMTPSDTPRYLAWANSLARLLRQLGLKSAPQPKASLAEHLARSVAP
jgi:hypothetical protein